MYLLLAALLLLVSFGSHGAAFLLAWRAARGRPGVRGLAGVAGWYLASSSMITLAVMGQGELVVDETSMRVHVSPSGPAARAGMRDADRVVTAAGERITSWDQLRATVGKSGGGPIVVEVDRGGEPVSLTVTPEGAPPRISVGPHTEQRSVSVGRAFFTGLTEPGELVATTFKALWRMMAGSERPDLSGPLGLLGGTSQKYGFSSALRLGAVMAAYMLPFVLFGTALYEILARRRA